MDQGFWYLCAGAAVETWRCVTKQAYGGKIIVIFGSTAGLCGLTPSVPLPGVFLGFTRNILWLCRLGRKFVIVCFRFTQQDATTILSRWFSRRMRTTMSLGAQVKAVDVISASLSCFKEDYNLI